uniref:Uncharacterized protein n=1 Tax=Anopheles atroparvus TaxID=41427 RepID=A0A182JBG4_ANOAO
MMDTSSSNTALVLVGVVVVPLPTVMVGVGRGALVLVRRVRVRVTIGAVRVRRVVVGGEVACATAALRRDRLRTVEFFHRGPLKVRHGHRRKVLLQFHQALDVLGQQLLVGGARVQRVQRMVGMVVVVGERARLLADAAAAGGRGGRGTGTGPLALDALGVEAERGAGGGPLAAGGVRGGAIVGGGCGAARGAQVALEQLVEEGAVGGEVARLLVQTVADDVVEEGAAIGAASVVQLLGHLAHAASLWQSGAHSCTSSASSADGAARGLATRGVEARLGLLLEPLHQARRGPAEQGVGGVACGQKKGVPYDSWEAKEAESSRGIFVPSPPFGEPAANCA